MGLPRVARIRQRLRDEHIADVPGAVRAAISACHAVERVRPGSRVAITAGSRGIAHIDTIIAAVASELRARGGEPFLVPAMGSHGGAPVLLGLAIVENAFEQPYRIVATNPEGFHDTDRQLLQLANRLLPRIPFDHLDVLVVDWIGKNISGSGMDPNVIGIWRRLGGERRPDYRRIVALDLTPESHGNALGIGWADFTTRRLVDSIDQQAMFMNCVTANAPDVGKIPFALADDRAAIEVALKTAARDGESARLARVHSTLHLSELYVSESLVAEVKDNALLEVVAPPAPMQFDGKGRLRPPVLSVQ